MWPGGTLHWNILCFVGMQDPAGWADCLHSGVLVQFVGLVDTSGLPPLPFLGRRRGCP